MADRPFERTAAAGCFLSGIHSAEPAPLAYPPFASANNLCQFAGRIKLLDGVLASQLVNPRLTARSFS